MHWMWLLFLSILSTSAIRLKSDQHTKDWWERAGFYQVYPRSFKDSDGDGIGDLNGITEKLSYLKDIGMRGFWLSPMYKSPMADFGYDISDFRDIQPEYGTMNDFRNQITEAKRLGLKVILDFVPNHSSDEHEWFVKSANREAGYEDYYVWRDAKPNPDDPNKPLPPNNWLSGFRGSAWQWNEQRQQFYYHLFTAKQPDLNFRNPKVVEEMKDILLFWLDLGVDGFRIDSVGCMFEVPANENGDFPDEPLSGTTEDSEDFAYLEHIYTIDRLENVEMVYQWRTLLENYQTQHGGDTRILMTESWSNLDIIKPYFKDIQGHEGAQMPFNFRLITELNITSTAYDFKNVIDSWMAIVDDGYAANWVLGNHDRSRLGTRMGEQRIDSMAMIELTLPGVSVTYQGEEIGMTDVDISWEETVDPAGCNEGIDNYAAKSRDPVRTPFQWDDSNLAGFTNGTGTWLPVGSNYRSINVKVESSVAKSHLNIFKSLMKLRESDTFLYGDWRTIAINEQVFAIVRDLKSSNRYITLVNLGSSSQTVDAGKFVKNISKILIYAIVSGASSHNPGDSVTASNIVLQPYEAFVLEAERSVDRKMRAEICERWLID
ncbi:maltase A3-like [Topomyia yanbarensis]|uniref:maltase A3-like n=1 Tax=Topomyia yanbarensis TaxID=2498891 RepID=UPI00273C9980|nr:maltase A3-like [Topomyia yanbarensis]